MNLEFKKLFYVLDFLIENPKYDYYLINGYKNISSSEIIIEEYISIWIDDREYHFNGKIPPKLTALYCDIFNLQYCVVDIAYNYMFKNAKQTKKLLKLEAFK